MPTILFVSVFAALCACATSPARPAPPQPRALLVVDCPVRDATVWIDDQPIGEVARLTGGIRLAAGEHRVELRHDSHHPRFAEVTLAPGERRVLTLPLTAMEP